MVGRSYSLNMSGVESTDLRIALYETKEDVQRLHEELDAEREATATSASEAMSMILRLQGEKAALVMEANQYKRMVEERMSHAELSLDLLEDLNYQKEVEIKNLESELHAYRSKLMSLGCRSDDDHITDDGIRCWDRSQTPSPEPVDIDLLVPVEKGVIEQSLDSSRRDQEKIKKLEEQLKELMEFRDSIRDKIKETFSVSETKIGVKGKAFAATSSSSIQDIVEVVQTKEKKMCKKSSKRKRDKSIKKDLARGTCSAIEAEYQAELQRLKERVERLERERGSGGESQTSGVNQEMMSLQRKSEEESNSLKPEMKSSRAIIDVQEAMLYFWL
ncbi:unnamed protein product [Microthlaspi erraticum]|uniref:GTD-binding domain-containing protein n=1 Tax=Microthlaspi erraticum TaxID=1685480 RepID=A0A6D2IZM8_9BRAS|nr:unnamed protein product [Microthlaspi erraticum]